MNLFWKPHDLASRYPHIRRPEPVCHVYCESFTFGGNAWKQLAVTLDGRTPGVSTYLDETFGCLDKTFSLPREVRIIPTQDIICDAETIDLYRYHYQHGRPCNPAKVVSD